MDDHDNADDLAILDKLNNSDDLHIDDDDDNNNNVEDDDARGRRRSQSFHEEFDAENKQTRLLMTGNVPLPKKTLNIVQNLEAEAIQLSKSDMQKLEEELAMQEEEKLRQQQAKLAAAAASKSATNGTSTAHSSASTTISSISAAANKHNSSSSTASNNNNSRPNSNNINQKSSNNNNNNNNVGSNSINNKIPAVVETVESAQPTLSTKRSFFKLPSALNFSSRKSQGEQQQLQNGKLPKKSGGSEIFNVHQQQQTPSSPVAKESIDAFIPPSPSSTVVASVEEYIKILLLGDSGTGKTSLMLRFAENIYQPNPLATAGVDWRMKKICFPDGRRAKVQVWDTAGQERFRVVTRAYYKGAQAIALVFDVTNRETFDHVAQWLESIKKNASSGTLVCLIGNKSDCSDRKVTLAEAKALATENKLRYCETSAKEGTFVTETFELISELVIMQKQGIEVTHSTTIVGNDNTTMEAPKSPGPAKANRALNSNLAAATSESTSNRSLNDKTGNRRRSLCIVM